MTLDEILEAMRDAEKFIFHHSEPWYTTGEDARRKIRSAITALEGMQWQPIETAPKGISVLVYPPTWINLTASIARWDDDEYAKNPKPYWNRSDDLGERRNSRNNPPTHWMPLPAAPNETGEE